MKNKRHIIFIQIAVISGLLLFFLFCRHKEQNMELHVRSIAEWSLDAALEKDLHMRKKASKQSFLFGQISASSSNSIKRGIEFKSEDKTEFIPYDSILQIRKARTKDWEFNATQTSITKDLPVMPQKIDSIFQKELEQKKIHASSLIKCTYKGNVSYSSPDTSLFSSSVRTVEIKSGLENEVVLQAFLRYPPLEYYEKAETIFFLLFICALIFTLYARFIQSKKEKKSNGQSEENEETTPNVIIPQLDPGICLEKEGTEIYHVNENYIFDFSKNMLFSTSQPICITHQNSITLKALLEAPDFMMKQDSLCTLIWGKNDIDCRRLYQVIKRVKYDVLIPATNLTIISINKNYQLCVDKSENKIGKKNNKKQSQPE